MLVGDSVLEEIKQVSKLVSEGETGTTDGAAVDTPTASKKAKGLSKILAICIGLTPQEKIKQELDCYLSHPQLEMKENPLYW